MSKKQEYGQYYTTQYRYILQNLHIPEDINTIVEPFCGEGHLLQFIDDKTPHELETYDIDPKLDNTVKQDTLENPPNYNDKFILTNPPYLARNKSANKELYDKYNTNDLYKCFLKELLENQCAGGIIIIPLNFWSSIRKADVELRGDFLRTYKILHLNIFEESVFNDTTYTVCSFQFELRKNTKPEAITTIIYPSKKRLHIMLHDNNSYTFGGEIYNLPLEHKYKITRLTSKNLDKKNTNVVVKCIDDNKYSQIGLSLVEEKDVYIDDTPNQTARTYATLVIEPALSNEQQKQLVVAFNEYLTMQRKKYNSLFLTNYRESKSIARKRISFDLVYNIVEYLLDTTSIPYA
tara:strand:+ start:1023 stop:2069 length:1047 start_codon:yes stop_codon:yes gene_type:complete